MITLPTSFRSDGFTFTLLERRGQVALFQKTKPNHSRPHFEVVIVQKNEDYTIHRNFVPAHESMPSNESWGTKGWTPFDLPAAKTLFASLTKVATPPILTLI